MKIMRRKYKNLKVLMRVGEILFAVIVFPQTTKGIECNSQPQFYVQPRFVFRIIYTGNGGDQEERKIPIQCSGIEMKEKLARLMTNI